MSSADQHATAFWSYALRVYGAPGVKEACLGLQDRHGVDVNILLFSAFLAAEKGRAVSVADCRRLIAATEDWRNSVVQALRVLRRDMKARASGDPRLEFVYQSLKRTELDAERAQHLLLLDCLPDSAGAGAADAVAALRCCLGAFGLEDPEPPAPLAAAVAG